MVVREQESRTDSSPRQAGKTPAHMSANAVPEGPHRLPNLETCKVYRKVAKALWTTSPPRSSTPSSRSVTPNLCQNGSQETSCRICLENTAGIDIGRDGCYSDYSDDIPNHNSYYLHIDAIRQEDQVGRLLLSFPGQVPSS